MSSLIYIIVDKNVIKLKQMSVKYVMKTYWIRENNRKIKKLVDKKFRKFKYFPNIYTEHMLLYM